MNFLSSVGGYNLEQIVAALPVGVYVCEAPEGAIRFWNKRAAELWGREPVAGDPDERFCGSLRLRDADGTVVPHASSPMANVLRTGAPFDGEITVERPDGSRVVVRVHIAALRDADGRITGAVNAFQDVTELRRAAEALRLSEARYRAVVEDQPDLVCRFLGDGTLTFANQAYCTYFGIDHSTVVGRSFTPLLYPDDLPHAQALVASLSPTNPVVSIENRVIRADGTVRWTEWTNRALYDENGALIEYQSAGRDVTERKRAEGDAARLAAIVTSADTAIYAMTLDGVITSWNRAAERMFGYSAAAAVGRHIAIIVPPDRVSEVADMIRRVRAGDTITHLDTERLSIDGTLVPLALTASPIRETTGRITGISIIARDIRAQKAADANLQGYLRTLERLYRLSDTIWRAQGLNEVCETAVEAIAEIAGVQRASILTFDERGVMRFKAWRGLSELYRAAVDGHSPWTPDASEPSPILIEDVTADESLGALRDVIASEGIRALAFIPLIYHGRLLGKFMLYFDVPHRFDSEEMRLAATIAHHVAFGVARAQADEAIAAALGRERSARAEADAARAEAERASEAKDEFLAMLAHELRNPLGAIATAVSVLELTAPDDRRYERSRAAIRRQTEHLSRLLDDLLDVARITRGQIELHKAVLDLRTAIQLGVDSQRHRIDAKGQTLILRTPDQPVAVMGDSVRLQQVFGNILHNASKYTGAGGTISVSLAVARDHAVVRMRDDGTGIAPDRLEWIFELFTQANPTLARTEGGLGIGLTVARRLVGLHDGRISAVSAGVGYGSEFVIELPIAAAASVDDAPPSTVPRVTRKRILVIEDHEDGREMLVTALRLHGHEVIDAATGREGLEHATRHAPDVILVDIGLPDIQGYDVARELRHRIGSGVRLIALTGYGRPVDRERSEQVGFHAHLLKPIDPVRLLSVLEQLA